MSTNSFTSSLFSVADKRVLITGGSRGIGWMLAKGFVAAGAHVVLTSRDENACRDAVQRIQDELSPVQKFHPPQYLASNVSNREGCEALAEQVGSMYNQRLDVLINNAGTSWGEPLKRESSKRSNWGFDKVLDLNVKGLVYLTRACMPMLKASSQPGDPSRVINIGSVVGIIPQAAPTHAYDISKAAVHHLTKKMSSDFAPLNITVNCLAPGFVPSNMSKGLRMWMKNPEDGEAPPDPYERMAKSIPLRRMGSDDDMIGACLYFSSRAGAYCTGVILPVDGGAIGAMQLDLDGQSKL